MGRKWVFLLLAVAGCLTACNSDLNADNASRFNGCTLEVDARKNPAVTATRGLTPSSYGNGLAAYWRESDQVTVQSAAGRTIGTMTPQTVGSASTRLKAQLTEAVNLGDQLHLIFPRTIRDYTGQVGTLDDIATKYDYATADVTVDAVQGTAFSTTDATFANQQAIVKFSLMSGTSALSASSLTISATGLKTSGSATGEVTITPASATNTLFAALSGVENQTVSLTASDGTDTYTYTQSTPKTFANGKYYEVTVNMTKYVPPFNPFTEPLTLEAVGDHSPGNTEITILNAVQLQYSKDKTNWHDWPEEGTVALSHAGERLYLRGTNATQTDYSDNTRIACTYPCYVYGNIMSLLDRENFATKTTLPYESTFTKLFFENKNIMHADGKDLVLPAKVLTENCYSQMFYGCTHLNHIRCLATDISAKDCTFSWVRQMPDSGTFVQAAGAQWADKNDGNGIPEGWTVITE